MKLNICGDTVPVKGIAALHAFKACVLHTHYTQRPRTLHAVVQMQLINRV